MQTSAIVNNINDFSFLKKVQKTFLLEKRKNFFVTFF
jgi:hypothetical protein